MVARYVIWDKVSDVITPIGEVLTPEEWMDRYPVAKALPTVVAGGTINGAFFGVYSQMVEMYEKMGCDFSGCTTEQEHLDAIEAFEDAMNSHEEGGSSAGGNDVWDEMAVAIEEGVNAV